MQQIRIDFDNPGLPQSLGAVEGESQSRIFQAALYKSGAAYTAPAGAVYSIMYRGFGPQNQGWYDTIEDGAGKRAACTVSGNVVTCELARQALRVPGHLTVVLCVSDAKGYMLKSWPINADVRNDGYEDTGESEMYFNLSGIAGNYLTQLEKAMANAETTRNNLTSTSAQVKKDIDAKAAAALKSIPESYTELDGSVKQLKEDRTDYYKNWYEIDEELAETRYEGYGWDGLQKTESSYMKCAEVSVKPDELYSFFIQIGNNWTGIAFVDANNSIIESYLNQKNWSDYHDYRIRAPKGSKKALINSNKNGSLAVYKLTNRKYKYILPGYYREHLNAKIKEINSAIGKDESQDYYGVGYIFVTDIHAPANTWTFLPLIERIRALTNAKMLINCGDNVRALGTKEDLISDLREVMNKTSSVFDEKMIYVLGNHDFVISDSDTWGTNMVMIAKALNYQINLSPLGISTRKHYYYDDDNVGMIRHIIIDYTDTDKSWFVEWLRDTIRSTPTDYHFAFYMHWNVFEKDGAISDAKYQYLVDWISALQKKTAFSENISTTFGDVKINEDYTDTTHAVCYFACGHQHMDYMHVVNGVTYFVSDCCANYNDNGIVNRVSGTTTDTAFDVICANVKKRSVTLIRIGAGSDRSWTY